MNGKGYINFFEINQSEEYEIREALGQVIQIRNLMRKIFLKAFTKPSKKNLEKINKNIFFP